jgi:hypothetical protein
MLHIAAALRQGRHLQQQHSKAVRCMILCGKQSATGSAQCTHKAKVCRT